MEKRYYSFAGMEFEISMPKEKFYENEYRLEPFRVYSVVEPHTMSFEWKEKLTRPAGTLTKQYGATHIFTNKDEQIRYISVLKDDEVSANMRVLHCGRKHNIEVNALAFPGKISVKSVLKAMSVEHTVLENQGFVLHCSYIDVKGKAVLFTAPSETGKSTQAELWKKLRGADIINGDRAVVRITEDGIVADGIPFAGSSNYCEKRTLPLQGIVYLDQANITSIKRIEGSKAFSAIWKGCSLNTWDNKDVEKLAELVKKVVEKVPIFYMPCTPDKSAVEAVEKMIFESEG